MKEIGNELVTILNSNQLDPTEKIHPIMDLPNNKRKEIVNPWIGIIYSDDGDSKSNWDQENKIDLSTEWQKLIDQTVLTREDWIEIEGSVEEWNGTRIKWKSLRFDAERDQSNPNYNPQYQGILDLEHFVGHRIRQYGDCYDS